MIGLSVVFILFLSLFIRLIIDEDKLLNKLFISECQSISHCPSSSVRCDAHRGLLCKDCNDPYYSDGWDGGCKCKSHIRRTRYKDA